MSFTELEDHLLAVTWAVALMHEKHRRFCMAKDIDEDIDRELHILEQLRGRLRADYTARFCVLYGEMGRARPADARTAGRGPSQCVAAHVHRNRPMSGLSGQVQRATGGRRPARRRSDRGFDEAL